MPFDIGKALAKEARLFWAGIEVHVWMDKAGLEDADEVRPQFPLV